MCFVQWYQHCIYFFFTDKKRILTHKANMQWPNFTRLTLHLRYAYSDYHDTMMQVHLNRPKGKM